jgi:hypothetical protein
MSTAGQAGGKGAVTFFMGVDTGRQIAIIYIGKLYCNLLFGLSGERCGIMKIYGRKIQRRAPVRCLCALLCLLIMAVPGMETLSLRAWAATR